MRSQEISKFLEEIAPKDLAYEGEEFDFIFGDESKDIKKIGVTWRPTVDVLKQAAENKIDLLITHEPLFHSEKSAIIPKEELTFSPNIERKEILSKNDILVYRYHSQWDDAKEGNNETLVNLFNLKNVTKIPYGRVGDITPISLIEFVEVVKEKLDCPNVLVTSDDDNKIVKKVAVISGSGNSLIEMIEYVKQKCADVLISGDIADGRARFAAEIKMPIIDVGGYYSEKPGIKKLYEILKKKFLELEVIFLDAKKPWRVL